MCFHNWSKWSGITDTSYSYQKRQFKICNKCGKIKSIYLGLDESHVPADIINNLIKGVK